MTEFLRFCAGVLVLAFIVWIIPSPVRGWIGSLLLLGAILTLIGVVTGSSPH